MSDEQKGTVSITYIEEGRTHETMKRLALLALIVLGATSLHAQTITVPPTTDPGFIDYGGAYCNLWVDYIPATIGGTRYFINTTIHFTPGNPAATYGSVEFMNSATGQLVASEPLTNITGALGPATGNSNFTASFAGAFTGTLTFNVDFKSSWHGRDFTYTMPNSSFVVNQ